MFILYALPLGIILGKLRGGSLKRLSTLQIRLGTVIALGMFGQVALFSAPVTERIGDLGPAAYILTTGVVLLAVAANWRMPGIPLVVMGATCNLAAILANGGYMPADPGALANIGHRLGTDYSNSKVVTEPALVLLTDIFPLPTWLPFTNVFSVGDVLIGIGVTWVIVAAMRHGHRPSRRARVGRPQVPAGGAPGQLGHSLEADGTTGS